MVTLGELLRVINTRIIQRVEQQSVNSGKKYWCVTIIDDERPNVYTFIMDPKDMELCRFKMTPEGMALEIFLPVPDANDSRRTT
jgi:hypothetical protein